MKSSASPSDSPRSRRQLSAGLEWLVEGGEMGTLISAYPWDETPLGRLEFWPQSLRTAVSLMLSSQHPMWIGWGPEMTFLYNDAYISVLSRAKHPWALGRPAAQVWAEIWDICGPLAEKVFSRAEASFVDDVELFMKRGDFTEETYYSFSYSPIRDEFGKVGGLFCPSAEVSSKVLNARRLATLSELAANSLVEKSVQRACATAFATLAKNPKDIPFALLYLLNDAGRAVTRTATLGVQPDQQPWSAETFPVQLNDANTLWRIGDVVNSGKLLRVALPADSGFPRGLADQRVVEAVVLPVTSRGDDRPLGVLIAGVNPARRLDQEYRTFYELISVQIATAIQNAGAAEEDRRRADELAELDRAKTTFFSNISHELRTPLTLMLGPLEELAHAPEKKIPAPERAMLELAQRNGLRLLKLVNTLLDFSRLEAGRMRATYEPINLASYTAELASTFASAVERAGLKLVIDCPATSEPAYVDLNLWEKIILNLLSNALKFTLQGEIRVRVREEGDHFVVAVQDTGVGIPAEAQPRLFERFFRVEGSGGRSQEGTGIGLALVHDLVTLHGGTIRAESAVGVGSTFTIEIPRGFRHLDPERLRAPNEHSRSPFHARPFVEEAMRWDDPLGARSSVEIITTKNESEAQAKALRGKVLLVDDNADMRDYVARLLSERFQVLTVGDGHAALDTIRRERPDLVLSDVMMPRLDGFGLIREIRGDPKLRAMPVILLSARAGDEARTEGVSHGADDYLTKPFTARELMARVETHLELAKVRRSAAEIAEGERKRLHDALMSAPAQILILRGPNHVIELSNYAHLQANGRSSGDQFVGRPIRDAQPEIEGQGFFELLDRVYQSGVAVSGRETKVKVCAPEGGVRDIFVNFVYQPTRDLSGNVDGIFVHAVDVTEQVLARTKVENLASRLTEANTLLEDRAALLERVVDQRTAKLRDTIAELESFSYSIAHDMRAPLRSLHGYSEVLLTDYAEALPSEARQFLQRIGTAATRMDKLIQDVLSYSKVVRGDLVLEPVSLGWLLKDIIQTYPLFAADKVRIDLPADLPSVIGNEAMLTQVFSNLLGNAVKFVAPGKTPHVRVWTENADKMAKIFIADNGIGIPEQQFEKIFEMFHQLDTSSGGTGIGLSIVKKAIERMKGSITVTSVVGQGSTFCVALPRA